MNQPINNEQAPLLLVDDDTTFCNVLNHALEKRGYTVTVAHSVEDATPLATDSPPEYAVVDLKIGGASGLVLVQALYELDPAMRIVAMPASPRRWKPSSWAQHSIFQNRPMPMRLWRHSGITPVIMPLSARNHPRSNVWSGSIFSAYCRNTRATSWPPRARHAPPHPATQTSQATKLGNLAQ